jgi:hypothetical protein
MSENTYPIGHTVRSKCGTARLTYQPDWSPSQPWASFKNGTAGRHFGTLDLGIRQLTQDGYRFAKDAKKVPAIEA